MGTGVVTWTTCCCSPEGRGPASQHPEWIRLVLYVIFDGRIMWIMLSSQWNWGGVWVKVAELQRVMIVFFFRIADPSYGSVTLSLCHFWKLLSGTHWFWSATRTDDNSKIRHDENYWHDLTTGTSWLEMLQHIMFTLYDVYFNILCLYVLWSHCLQFPWRVFTTLTFRCVTCGPHIFNSWEICRADFASSTESTNTSFLRVHVID